MGRDRILRLVAIIVIVPLAGLTLWAWLDLGPEQVRVAAGFDGLHAISWAGNVSNSGRLAVRITYDLGDDTDRTLSVRLPDGARYLRVDDTPTQVSSGYTTVHVSGIATIDYELPDVVTRYRDGALLTMIGVADGSLDNDAGLFPCAYCYIDPSGYGDVPLTGVLAVPGAQNVQLSFVNLRSIRANADDSEIRFAAVDRSAGAVAMVAVLPAEAVSGLPIRDGTVAQALATIESQVRAAGQSLQRPTGPDRGSILLAIIVTLLLAAPLAWLVFDTIWAKGARAAARAAGTPDKGHGRY